MRPLVSVIVPVYKVEKYLKRCLDSLQKQSLKDIEILLIDDNSPDRCGDICETYAKQDNRFKLFRHIKNRGLSAARNTGIKHAAAEFLMFVDSDDWVSSDFCKEAYETAIYYHADLVMFGYQHVKELGINKMEFDSIELVKMNSLSYEEAIDLTFEEFGMVAWNKLYHKKLFDDIHYPEGYLYEDTGTTYKLIWKAGCIYNINKILYYYFIRSDSITKRQPTKRSLNDWFKMSLQQCNDLKNWGYSSKRLDLRLKSIALSYCVKMNHFSPNYAIAAKILQDIKDFPQGFSWERKVLVKLFQSSPKMFKTVCFFLRRLL